MNEGRQLDLLLSPHLLFLQNNALLVRIVGNKVHDAVSVVDQAEARDREFHAQPLLKLFAPLVPSESTPALEGRVGPEVGRDVSLGFE